MTEIAARYTVDPHVRCNVRCTLIYPMEGTKRDIREIEMVGFRLSRDQAIDLARALLAVTQDWEEIAITGFRFQRRLADDTYPVIVDGITRR